MLDVTIVTPRKIAWKGQADDLQAPGELGEFGVLPKHIAFLSTLKPGVLKVHVKGGEQRWKIGTGFCEVNHDKVTVLTESAEEG